MTCPVCGKGSPCVHTHQADTGFFDQSYMDVQTNAGALPAAVGGALPAENAWRDEVASRVQQHRARRRKPYDPKALKLDFPAEGLHSFAMEPDHAAPLAAPPERYSEIILNKNKPEPKVIRFPRTQPTYVPTVEEVTLEELELAEPLPEMPRITEEPIGDEMETALEPEAAPYVAEPLPAIHPVEQMELLPSFADIQLEPEQPRAEINREVIPRPAELSQRLIAGLVDAGLVLGASLVFVLTFLKLAEEMPPARAMLACALAVSGIFWLLFQYIFLVYKRATPGMRFAQLELCTFSGNQTSIFARQYRVLASALSSFSLGLGYAWALVDEDRVGWHDRISQTHLRAIRHFDWQSVLKSRSAAREPYYYDDMKG